MTSDVMAIANDLAHYLRAIRGVSDVRPPTQTPRRTTGRRRPPMPAFLAPPQGADFEISFTYKNEPRTFRYYLDDRADPRLMTQVLRVHTNGELMVRVPDEYGHVIPNDIHYVNRINVSSGMIAPRR